jgi:CrcB protein
VSTRAGWWTSGVIATGGAVGASARWAVGTLLAPADSTGFPLHTFTVNVVGCLLIGLAATRIERTTALWAFVSTGILGGFTTMSSFAGELDALADAGRTTTALVYLVATLATGFGALLLGETIPGRFQPPPGTEDIE